MNDLGNEDVTNLDENQVGEVENDKAVEPGVSEEAEGQEVEAKAADGQGEDIEVDEEAGSQPSKANTGIRKRINALTVKKKEALAGQSQAEAALALSEQKRELLQMALDQKTAEPSAPAGPPDPADFDDGAKDAEYVEALEGYTNRLVQAQLDKHTATLPAPVADLERDKEREVKFVAHYEAAENLNVKDYAETEAAATDVVGQEAVNHIIKDIPGSHRILYRLGKNPALAQEIAGLIKTSPVAGIARLTVLGIANSGTQRNRAPDPDGELEGASVSRTGKTRRGPAGATFT